MGFVAMGLGGLLLAGFIFRDAPRYGWENCAGWMGAWVVLAIGGFFQAGITGMPVGELAWYASAAYVTVILVTLGRPAVLIPLWADHVDAGRDFGCFTRRERRIQAWSPWLLMAAIIAMAFSSV